MLIHRFQEKIVNQVLGMELSPKAKTALADFAISRASMIDSFAFQTWGSSIEAVRVGINSIDYGVSVPNDKVKNALTLDDQITHAAKAKSRIWLMDNGHFSVTVDVPYSFKTPSFSQLLTDGRFKRGQFMFGYIDGKPRYGVWQEVLNIIIAGMAQSGKTTTSRFMIAQHLMNGAQFVVIDPQARAGEKSLAGSLTGLPMIAPVAIDREEWLKNIAYVDAIGKKRSNGDTDRTPVILVVDEANDLFDDKEAADSMIDMLRKIMRAYCKVNINALVIGHDWRASATGGSASLREMFQSRYVHNMSKGSAQTLIDDRDCREAITSQKPGNAHLRFADGEIKRVAIPMTTSEDLRNIIRLMGSRTSNINKTLSWVDFTKQSQTESASQTRVETVSQIPNKMQVAGVELPGDFTVTEILNLIANGNSPSKIVEGVWGVTSGYKYQQGSKTVVDIAANAVRWAMSKGYQG